jgi:hypothetical protein
MEAYLWPYKGGTRRERLLAAGLVAELLFIWLGLYALSWALYT